MSKLEDDMMQKKRVLLYIRFFISLQKKNKKTKTKHEKKWEKNWKNKRNTKKKELLKIFLIMENFHE